MQNTNIHATLRRLLDANAHFALNGKGTTNHCPMVLCALAEMGATDERLHSFFARWERSYAYLAAPIHRTVNAANWRACVGDVSAFEACHAYFKRAIENAGVDAVLIGVLTELPFAPASAAFHAVIRLAYGLDAEHVGEIAAGLAALVCTNLPIPRNADARFAASVREGWTDLALAFGGASFTGNSITARLQAAASDPALGMHLPALPAGPQVLDDMADAAILAYVLTDDFTALHIVTGLHAVRRVLRRLPQAMANERMAEVWAAICVAYAVIGAPALPWPQSTMHLHPSDGYGDASWQGLLALAVVSDDDHVIKMTYTCWREYQRDRSPLYALAAQRLLRRQHG